MVKKTYVKGDRTRTLDSRDVAGVVRAEYAGWVEQTAEASADDAAAGKKAAARTTPSKAADTP